MKNENAIMDRIKARIAYHANEHRHTYEIGKGVMDFLARDLLATKGKPKRASASVHSIIDAPIGRHSEKPAETRDRIVQLAGGGSMIELFARKTAPGWDSWGDEVEGGENE